MGGVTDSGALEAALPTPHPGPHRALCAAAPRAQPPVGGESELAFAVTRRRAAITLQGVAAGLSDVATRTNSVFCM